MSNESSAARGALALSLAGILSKVISILYTPVLRSILGDSGYGVYGRVLEVFLFVYAITTVGAQPAVAKVVAELSAVGNKETTEKSLRVSTRMYALIGLFGTLIMMLLSFPIAKIIGKGSADNGIAYGILALSPCILITCILAAYRGYMQGNNKMKTIAVSQILEQFFNVLISLVCAYLFLKATDKMAYGVAGAQVGTSIGALVAILYIVYKYSKSFDEDFEEDLIEEEHTRTFSNKRIRKKILIYSFPIILSAGLQNLGGLVDMLNVSRRLMDIGFSKQNASALYGYYSIYKTFIGVPMVIVTAIGTAILPAISSARIVSDKKEIRSKVRFGYRTCLAVVIPAAVGLAMVAEPMYYSLFNNNRGYNFMIIGSFMLILMGITQVQTVIMQGINKFYYIIATFTIGILLKIILNYICVGIHSINIYGVLIGNCIWYLIPAVLMHKKIKRTTRSKISLMKISAKPIVASLMMAITIIIVKVPVKYIYRFVNPSRFVCIPILLAEVIAGGFVYIYVMIVTGGIRRRDITEISSRLLRLMPAFMRRKLK